MYHVLAIISFLAAITNPPNGLDLTDGVRGGREGRMGGGEMWGGSRRGGVEVFRGKRDGRFRGQRME